MSIAIDVYHLIVNLKECFEMFGYKQLSQIMVEGVTLAKSIFLTRTFVAL